MEHRIRKSSGVSTSSVDWGPTNKSLEDNGGLAGSWGSGLVFIRLWLSRRASALRYAR